MIWVAPGRVRPYMEARMKTENGNSMKFKGGFVCRYVPKYLNKDVLEKGNDNNSRLLIIQG